MRPLLSSALLVLLASAPAAQTALYIPLPPAAEPAVTGPATSLPGVDPATITEVCPRPDTTLRGSAKEEADYAYQLCRTILARLALHAPRASAAPPVVTFNVNANVTSDDKTAASAPATGHLGLTYADPNTGYSFAVQLNVLNTTDVTRTGFPATLLSPSSGGQAYQSGFFQADIHTCGRPFVRRVGPCMNGFGRIADGLDFVGGGFDPTLYFYTSGSNVRWGRPLATVPEGEPTPPDPTLDLTVLGLGIGGRWTLDLFDKDQSGGVDQPNRFAIGFYAGAALRALAGDGALSRHADFREELIGTRGTFWLGAEGGFLLRIGGFVGEVRTYWLPSMAPTAPGLGGLRVLAALSANVPLFSRPVGPQPVIATGTVPPGEKPKGDAQPAPPADPGAGSPKEAINPADRR